MLTVYVLYWNDCSIKTSTDRHLMIEEYMKEKMNGMKNLKLMKEEYVGYKRTQICGIEEEI